MVKSKWILKPQHDVSSLVSTGLSPIVLNVLKNRGLNTVKEIEKFINPSLDDLHDPFLLKGMVDAVHKIETAIANRKRICIFGDYDVDGITSTTILKKVFAEKLNYPVEYYIPNRHKEGYGLSNGAIDILHMQGVDLILTVDCGVSAVSEVEYAKSLGLDVVVSDHHEPPHIVPNCIIVNPHQVDCPYPNKNLAGCGVAFKLACALYPNLLNEPDIPEYLGIVAFGSIADIVPLKGENRIIAYYGCLEMGATSNLGLRRLIEKSGITDIKITAGQVGFNLAPKINAVGRVAKADLGVELFLSNDIEEVDSIVDELIKLNEHRQSIEGDMIEQAIAIIENDEKLKNGKVIFIAKDDWHTGVIGITASKICETYYKPTILLSINKQGICKGSGRSIPTFSIFDPLMDAKNKGFLIGGGGHAVSLGMSFEISQLENVKKVFEAHAERLTEEDLTKVVKIDSIIDNITVELVNQMSSLEPYSIGNPTPIFQCEGNKILNKKLLGKLQNHTKLTVDSNFECLAFKTTMEDVNVGDKVDLVGNISVNEFRGQTTAQMIVKDWRINE